ncbi:MAG: S8/S53 family peptidase [Polyangiales bacterium]
MTRFRSVVHVIFALALIGCAVEQDDVSLKAARRGRPSNCAVLSLPGDGSPQDPWQVAHCEELAALDADPTAHFVLVADLDCTYATMEPLGRRRPFEGTLDGAGHVISGVVVEDGLFQRTRHAQIHRLGLDGARVTGHGIAGVLVGQAVHTTIAEVAVRDAVLRTTGGGHVGGLVGRATHTQITDSYVSVDVLARRRVGAIAGSATQSQIATSYAVVPEAIGILRGSVPRHVALHDAFFDADVTPGHDDSAAEGAASTADLQSQSFFEGSNWDFESTWGFRGPGYPCLRWEDECSVVRFVVDPSVVPQHEDREYGALPLAMARLVFDGVGFEYFVNTFVVEASASEIGPILESEALTVLEVDEPQHWDDSENLYLVQSTTSTPPCLDMLEQHVRVEEPGLDGVMTFSSDAAKETLCVMLRMARSGHLVDLDGPMDDDTYTRGSDNLECPNGTDTSGQPCTVVARSKNVFDWVDFASRHGSDFSVPQAWEALAATGAVPHVTANIADHGFVRTPDFDGDAGESFVPGQGLFESSRWGTAWHGAACAAALSAVPDNQWGVVGTGGRFVARTVIWGIENRFQVRRAMRSSRRQHGASILSISNSYGGPRRLRFVGRGMERTARHTRNRGTLVFASAGNEGQEFSGRNRRQMPCELDAVECVGGLRQDSQFRHLESNWGARVDFFAPYVGAGFDATRPPVDEINEFNGTSYSTPYVAGIATLVWTADGSLSPDEVVEILRRTAQTSTDPQVTRIVSPYNAVIDALGVRPPRVDLTRQYEGTSLVNGAPFAVLARITVGDSDVARVALSSNRRGVLAMVSAPSTGVIPLSWTPGELDVGRHVLDVVVEDDLGRATSESFEVFVEEAEQCPSLTNASVTLLASDGTTDTLLLEVTANDVPDGPLSDTVEWYMDGVWVAQGDEVVLSYSTGVPFCELDPSVIVAARDSSGCFALRPVDDIRGCP